MTICELRHFFESIKPDSKVEGRMLNNVINEQNQKYPVKCQISRRRKKINLGCIRHVKHQQ